MVDQITMAIAAIDIQWFTEVSKFLDVFTYPLLILVWLLIVTRGDRKRAIALALSAVLVTAAVLHLKDMYGIERPCAVLESKIESKIPCPSDGSFPSGHATAAAMFLPAFLGSWAFLPYLLFYLVTATSRIYLGVHAVEDVTGGTVIGIAAYFIAEFFVGERQSFVGKGWNGNRPLPLDKETKRQLFHMAFGIIVMLAYAYLVYFGQPDALEFIQLAVLMCLLGGLFLLNIKMSGRGTRIPIIDVLLKEMERPGRIPGYGSFWFVVGLLITLSFLNNPSEVLATIFVVSVPDSISTLGGRMGKVRLPYNRLKTAEGSALFFLSSLLVYPMIGPTTIFFALFLAIVESLPIPFDDNMMLPAAAAVFFSIL